MAVPAHSPRVYRRRRQRIRRLLFFFLAITALFYFIHSGFFSLENIVITGNDHIATTDLEGLLGVTRGTNLWQLDTGTLARRLATHPLVAGAQVSRRWPHTLLVRIQERVPVALLVADGSFLLVDATGMVMERVSQVGSLNLPLISGLDKLAKIGPGSRIDNPALAAALAVLQQVPAADLNQLREIVAPAPGNLQLIWAGQIRVRFGDSQQVAAKLDRLHEALQGLPGNSAVDYIDVSFAGPPVIKFTQNGNPVQDQARKGVKQ
ncbi:cell division protein FtsQ/DivIB [Moorella sp. Hama-1]|uniref:cell division protein FtsQ/DivIB n=1 Tax=Moorella sp. Hama-1 TaxID=2138101 RepID=UPI000D649CEF|nr:FtsQ-type POTRA domain-containing protein [Moorella sp. Hama-1]MDN5361208.1 cell division protein FtsQ [Moorella sp. (in: firmicutes)]BCV20890.1 cell division protein FtsQ [Moorella sp. Hama-1]